MRCIANAVSHVLRNSPVIKLCFCTLLLRQVSKFTYSHWLLRLMPHVTVDATLPLYLKCKALYLQEVMQLDEQVGLIALGRFKSCVRTTLLLCQGYECQEGKSSISAAFASPCQAFEWAVALQLALLRSASQGCKVHVSAQVAGRTRSRGSGDLSCWPDQVSFTTLQLRVNARLAGQTQLWGPRLTLLSV